MRRGFDTRSRALLGLRPSAETDGSDRRMTEFSAVWYEGLILVLARFPCRFTWMKLSELSLDSLAWEIYLYFPR